MSSETGILNEQRVGVINQNLTLETSADDTNHTQNSASRLAQFAFNSKQTSRASTSTTSNINSAQVRSTNAMVSPPAQSRDATNSSRFFTPSSTTGRVLVPNSSPLTHTASSSAQSLSINGRDGAQISKFNPPGMSRPQSLKLAADPLSRPSGFVASTGVNNATGTRSDGQSMRSPPMDDDSSDNERPRKRANLIQSSRLNIPGTSSPGSPESPDIVRAGQKRKLGSNRPIAMSSSVSSEEAFSMSSPAIAGPSNSRIVRSERPQSQTDPGLTKFRLVNVDKPASIVEAAWHAASGDTRKATNLLLDPDFGPSQAPSEMPSSSSPPVAKVVGKVEEFQTEREAKRAQEKQLAAKSAIYRTQRLDATPPPSSSPSQAAESKNYESSPDKPRPIKRIAGARRRVADSASEEEPDVTIEVDSDSEIEIETLDSFEKQTLDAFNKLELNSLRELAGCTATQAEKIISLRPYGSVDDLKKRLGQGKKKAGPAGISPRMFVDCVDIYRGYGNVDQILKGCEHIGRELRKVIDSWTSYPRDKGKGKEVPDTDSGAIELVAIAEASHAKGFITKPPSLLAPGVQLKDYQLTGISWLRLLHSKKYSCILADEMGLGKTVQVISFFAQLKEQGCPGPHLIVVPSSTLENWCREFERFAPSMVIQTYYGSKDDRPELRENLLRSRPGRESRRGKSWEVLITTYNLAVGDGLDRKFFRKIPWDTCVFDEGHVLKNFQSQRYTSLMKIDSKWKLLLTGTPLQNNLQELVSVMNFILPDKFGDEDVQENLRAIFKVKGDSKQLLAEDRVKRAKTMMTPFVLRRRKDQVLKDLPKKTERIEWCAMTSLQRSIYQDAKRRSRKLVMDETDTKGSADVIGDDAGSKAPKKTKANAKSKEKKYLENTSNVLMDLRKAASHPMLFRTQFTDSVLSKLTNVLLKEPDFRKRGAVAQYVKEDMEVMTDSELQVFCGTYKSTQRFLLPDECYIDSGKITTMLKLLDRYRSEDRKVLIFSQFTQILDILQVVLKQRSIKFLLLTGSTAVDIRQGLVDEFTVDDSIPVFLLSTKAGGMGINLTAASVVILFDQDFNPHNDRQAADRAYRIGQRRDVEIVKLISRGTIEEDMYRLGATKLALDEAVAGEAEEGDGDSKAEKIMRASLMDSLRKQFDEESDDGADGPATREQSKGAELAAKTSAVLDIASDSDLTDIEIS